MPWYALHVRSNCERVVDLALAECNIESFYPSRRVEVFSGRNKRIVERAMLPGYVFSRFDFPSRRPIASIPQVVNIVGYGDVAVAIPESEVNAMRRLAVSGMTIEPHRYIAAGENVLVKHGPLTGLDGFVVRSAGESRFVVSVHILGRSISVQVDAGMIEPTRKAA